MLRSLCGAAVAAIASASSYDVETYGSVEAAIAQVEARHETFRGLQVRPPRALCLSNSRQHARAPRPTCGGLVATDARAAAPLFPLTLRPG